MLSFVTSCRSAPPLPVKTESLAQPAHLMMINLSDYAWQVRAVPSSGGAPLLWSLPPRETSEFVLPAGDYVVEQTVLLKPNVPGSTRHFEFSAEAGQTYRWQVGTLLSDPGTVGPRK